MSTQNTGTSIKVPILIMNMRTNKYFKVKKFSLGKAVPPEVSSGNSYEAISIIKKWINPWPEIAFEKIIVPKYDGSNPEIKVASETFEASCNAGVYQYLGEPSNKPDFIKDYHIISLARLVDYWAEPVWSGKINASVNSVSFVRKG